jgi:1,4-alpha-glucan branching enzyme
VDRCHQAGLGVLLDWVPSHFAKEGHGLGIFDGAHLFEHADPRQGESSWGSYVFNYGRHEVRNFLIASALFWVGVYHLDGFRLDAVASMLYLDFGRERGAWLPNAIGGRENLEAIDFLRRLNTTLHERFPGILTCAEESTVWPKVTHPVAEGGLGFDIKWNMGWMNDILYYMELEPVHRRYHQSALTFSFHYASFEHYLLPLSHDEVIHLKHSLLDKMPGDTWQKFANLRLLLGHMWAHPGKKLLFMGGEFGQWGEWAYARSLDWHLLQADDHHRRLQDFVRALNTFYAAEPALHEQDFSAQGFAWIDGNDDRHSVVAFLRYARDRANFLVVVGNYTPVVRPGYRIGVPAAGAYVEVLNSDASAYGGSGVANALPRAAAPVPSTGHPYSITLTLPPLGIVVLRPQAATTPPR